LHEKGDFSFYHVGCSSVKLLSFKICCFDYIFTPQLKYSLSVNWSWHCLRFVSFVRISLSLIICSDRFSDSCSDEHRLLCVPTFGGTVVPATDQGPIRRRVSGIPASTLVRTTFNGLSSFAQNDPLVGLI
jgi:hypothetical protein